MTSISADNLSVSFTTFESEKKQGLLGMMMGIHGRKQNFQALKDVSLHFDEGDRVALLGKNGAGKTVLLKTLSGLLPPTEGNLQVSGDVLPAIDMSAGLVLPATCMQNIVLRGLSFGLRGKRLKNYVDTVAKFTELGDFLNSPVSSLSAGMRSRLVVSTFNAIHPEILLMDEWIGVADKKIAEKQNGLLENLVKQTKIFVLASHRESLIKAHCNRALVLDGGKIVFSGGVDDSLKYFNSN